MEETEALLDPGHGTSGWQNPGRQARSAAAAVKKEGEKQGKAETREGSIFSQIFPTCE